MHTTAVPLSSTHALIRPIFMRFPEIEDAMLNDGIVGATSHRKDAVVMLWALLEESMPVPQATLEVSHAQLFFRVIGASQWEPAFCSLHRTSQPKFCSAVTARTTVYHLSNTSLAFGHRFSIRRVQYDTWTRAVLG